VVGEPTNGEPNIIPMQLFRIGNLAIIGLPWEVTTMAGRRLRKTVLDELKSDGVDYVVINGLSNGYMHYLTTREEYAIQQYEGASNVFGPWSLAAVQQSFRGLARDMVNGYDTETGDHAALPLLVPQNPNQHTTDLAPVGSNFGDVIIAPNATYAPGDTVRVVFQASSPNSDFKTGSSFLFIERQVDNDWQLIAVDTDPETSFVWHADTPEPQFISPITSTAEILWRVPRNTESGVFRIRFEGVANQGGILTEYEGISQSLEIDGLVASCP
jgi:neutral ceramidase